MSLTDKLAEELKHPMYHPPTPGSVWCKHGETTNEHGIWDGEWIKSKEDYDMEPVCGHCRKEVSWGEGATDSLQVWSSIYWYPSRIHKKCACECVGVPKHPDKVVFVEMDGLIQNMMTEFKE